MIDLVSPPHSMDPGASLRDRATLPSPLRGLGPAGGYPSRLHSLRSLRAPLTRRLASLSAARRRWHSRTPPCLLPRQLPSAHSPRRLAFGSGPGTAFPFVRYPGSGPSYALRRLGSHTPRSALPKTTPPTFHYAPATFDLPSSTPEYDTGRHEYVGQSVYGFHIRFISLICMKKRDPAFHRESL